jgi:hypothetical protein
MRWDAYDSLSQTISELSAIGAPTRGLWVWLAVAYGVLLAAFACGVWRSASHNRRLRIAAGLLLFNALMGFAWPPMHLREELALGRGTLTDTLHLVFAAAWALSVLVAMGFAAAALGKQLRRYSVATMTILIVFGALTGLYGPRIAANQPTPWVGLFERINVGAYLLWIGVLAMVLSGEHAGADDNRREQREESAPGLRPGPQRLRGGLVGRT